jgi:hypothetical protein
LFSIRILLFRSVFSIFGEYLKTNDAGCFEQYYNLKISNHFLNDEWNMIYSNVEKMLKLLIPEL